MIFEGSFFAQKLKLKTHPKTKKSMVGPFKLNIEKISLLFPTTLKIFFYQCVAFQKC